MRDWLQVWGNGGTGVSALSLEGGTGVPPWLAHRVVLLDVPSALPRKHCTSPDGSKAVHGGGLGSLNSIRRVTGEELDFPGAERGNRRATLRRKGGTEDSSTLMPIPSKGLMGMQMSHTAIALQKSLCRTFWRPPRWLRAPHTMPTPRIR